MQTSDRLRWCAYVAALAAIGVAMWYPVDNTSGSADRPYKGPGARPAIEPTLSQNTAALDLGGEAKGDPFAFRTWEKALSTPTPTAAKMPVTAVSSQAIAPIPPALFVPAAPPISAYRYAGNLVQDGRRIVYLAKGDEVFAVGVGDRLESLYRVESIDDSRVTLIHLISKESAQIEF